MHQGIEENYRSLICIQFQQELFSHFCGTASLTRSL